MDEMNENHKVTNDTNINQDEMSQDNQLIQDNEENKVQETLSKESELKADGPVENLPPAKTKLGYVELVYGALVSPVETFRKLAKDTPLFSGFLIFLTVAVLNAIVNSVTPAEISGLPKEYVDILPKLGPIVGIIGIFLSLVFWIVEAGVLQVIAELLGGGGKAASLLTVIALSEVPKVLSIPFQVIKYVTKGSSWGANLYSIVAVGVFIWGLVLLVLGIKETHEISTWRAIATVLIPFLLATLFVVLLAVGFAAVLIPYVQNLGI